MKKSILLFIFCFGISICSISQNNLTKSSGESLEHKKTDNAKALNEAIMDAQTNAVIAFGGNINVQSSSRIENTTESEKGKKDKKYETSGSFSAKDKFFLQNSVSAMVKNIEITADTIWISKKKYKVRVNGKFEVNLKEMGNYITDYLNNSDKKIKIEVKENDCFGHIYKPLSEYINSKKNNFIFSNQPWLLGESDYKIEINSDRAVLYDKRQSPNITIKVYPYKSCQSVLDKGSEENQLLDEMINDMYAVYIYKSIK